MRGTVMRGPDVPRTNGAGERTNRFCMYLSLMFSHDDMQLEMYK